MILGHHRNASIGPLGPMCACPECIRSAERWFVTWSIPIARAAGVELSETFETWVIRIFAYGVAKSAPKEDVHAGR